MSSQKKRVVIIGAGISGLSCARQLAKYHREIDITLLEASDRIGGRVRSYTAEDGTVLELGAQFIHGTVGNPIYDFAVDKGIITPQKDWVPYEITKLFDKSVDASKEEKDIAIQLAFDYEEEVISKLINGSDIPSDKSLGHYMKRHFDDFQSNYTGTITKCLEALFNYAFLNEADFNGIPCLNKLDLKSYKEYMDLPGHQQCISFSSYSEIVKAMYADIPPNILRRNHKVTSIEYTKEKGLSVSCDNGATFECDIAVLTVSLEVLKHLMKEGTFFIPSLPREKSRALTHVRLSRVVKMFFKFQNPRAVPKELKDFQFYPSNGYLKNTGFSGLTNIDRVADSDWWLVLINGCILDEYENSTNSLHFLKTCLTKIKENYPEFPKDLEIDSDSIISTDWTNDPLFLGGYSYFECGGNAREDIEVLRRPAVFENELGKYHLMFSGEITEEKYYSTTHAAFESGIRDGKVIEGILQLDQK